MPPVIELRDVWKTYRMSGVEVHALRGLSLTVEQGEFLSLRGPSGSGKSTAMHLIGCLDLPSRGKVLLKGKDIAQLPESSLARIRGKTIGFVFQQFNLIPTLSALDNVCLPMLFQGVSREKREQRGRSLLERMSLSDRLRHLPAELSGGQLQRVAIPRALANDPEVILADEPTGNLDSATGKSVLELIGNLHREDGKTIILVTHDQEIARYAKREEYILDGRLR